MLPRLRVEVAADVFAAHGQDPTWDSRTGTLLWVDRPSRTAHRFRPGGQDRAMELPQQVGGAKPRSRGGLALHLADGLAVYAGDGQERTWLAYWAREGFRGEVTATDAFGRLWASTVPDGGSAADSAGQLVRVDPNAGRRVTTASHRTVRGLAWSPDSSAVYLLDGAERSIVVSDFDLASGTGSDPRTLCWLGGGANIDDGASVDGGASTDDATTPRGLCVDAEGCLWLALDGAAEIRRYTPEGVLDTTAELPVRRPTGCCFGGPELTDLYVTSARAGLTAPEDADGALLVLPDAGKGLRSTAFAG